MQQRKIQELVQKYGEMTHTYYGISVVYNTQEKGFALAESLLQELVDRQTVLYVSGGKTPKDLYHMLAKSARIQPGVVGLVDERFGEKGHSKSNELMLKDSGLFDFLTFQSVPFTPILQKELIREEAAEQYDQQLREWNSIFPKSVAVLGVGLDGHTAGIPAGKLHDSSFETDDPHLYDLQNPRLVTSFNDPNGMYKERITMTFTALAQLEFLLVLVFGNAKKEALTKLFSDGPLEEVPSRFFTLPEIAAKTLLITDQEIL